MTIEQTAMAMWAGSLMAQYTIEKATGIEWKQAWEQGVLDKALWRSRARRYLRAIGKIK